MFRKLQDCFEIFLKWNVIFNAFPVFIYHNFTALLSLPSVHWLLLPVFERRLSLRSKSTVDIMCLALARNTVPEFQELRSPDIT